MGSIKIYMSNVGMQLKRKEIEIVDDTYSKVTRIYLL